MTIHYSYIDAPNLFIQDQHGKRFAYRELGEKKGTPIILLTHLSANLDNWDPRIIDGLAKSHWVIAFDNVGVGLSDGKVPNNIPQMANDAIAFIKLLGFSKIDLIGLSMGGMIAQELIVKESSIVRKLVLVGTGPRGGKGISNVTNITNLDFVRSIFTFRDIKTYLFFQNTKNGKNKAKEFLIQIKKRKNHRDKSISLRAYRSQLEAINKWGKDKPEDLSKIVQPTLIINGDHDRMVPTENSHDLANRIPGSKLKIFEHAGHGSLFQYPKEFVEIVIKFLS
ncbi:alpha/beta fold hydrolase [Alkalicoccobacillus murimartini]|uniref:Pimeloyl-ACP methyl ester carboxylesterase n=1 Tax=Alkalicoccobacillus murimartini TaxID=171685 RepID=A0ABT9YI51_9BACI|nr:alpha/beta hydrolase [Alkalicoccobacillus murimartini]MDQ0207512.1 pimeloyl-ACP methyl ester carboxylesterase [Alkalicoccobacillus murimartini]